jgi:Zn-dependent protease
MNLLLAMLAALAFHFIDYVPAMAASWIAENLKNALLINVVLAVFNMLPLPPLDGGRIVVGILPSALSRPLERIEPYGLPILIGILFILPLLGAQLGVNLDFIAWVIARATNAIVRLILLLTANS